MDKQALKEHISDLEMEKEMVQNCEDEESRDEFNRLENEIALYEAILYQK